MPAMLATWIGLVRTSAWSCVHLCFVCRVPLLRVHGLTHALVCTHAHIRAPVCHTRAHTGAHMWRLAHASSTCTSTCIIYVHAYACIIYVHAYAAVRACTRTQTQTRACARAHTHTHTLHILESSCIRAYADGWQKSKQGLMTGHRATLCLNPKS